jgi:hypothetical protein
MASTVGRNSHTDRPRAALIGWIALTIACSISLFAIENLWIDPWLRHRVHRHRIPHLVPEALSGLWFVVFACGAIALVLALVSLILLARDRYVSLWFKLVTGLALVATIGLFSDWFWVSSGHRSFLPFFRPPHTVTLRWKPSPLPVVGYNVYRKTPDEKTFVKLNLAPIMSLTYTDENVRDRITYEYMARGVDTRGRESADSNHCTVTVP